MTTLAAESCVACRPDSPAVTAAEMEALKTEIPQWTVVEREGIARLEPPALEPELDRVEGFGPHDVVAAVGGGDHPVTVGQPIDLQRASERIDEPQIPEAFARVDPHLPRAVDTSGAGGDDLTHPVRCQGHERGRGDRGHPLLSPASEVRNEHVVAEVQLRLVENPPPAGRVAIPGRPIEAVEQDAADRRRCERVR